MIDPLIICSDLHGTIEGLFQPLLKCRLIERHDNHVRWCQNVTTTVLILGDITNRVRNNDTRSSPSELKHEELLILIYVHYLNMTHPTMKEPIVVLLGNHDYLNFLGIRSLASRKSREFMKTLYNERTIKKHNLPGRLKDYDSRSLFFMLDNKLDANEKNHIARQIVEHKLFPHFPLFFRDFLRIRVCVFLPTYNLLAMHGGMHPNEFVSHDKLDEWCRVMNKSAYDSICSFRMDRNVAYILNNRRLAGSIRCEDMPEYMIAIGHSRPRDGIAIVCDRLFRTDFGNNAYTQCKNRPCAIAPYFVVIDGKGSRFVTARRKSTAICIHDIYQYDCRRCKLNGVMWTKNDFINP